MLVDQFTAELAETIAFGVTLEGAAEHHSEAAAGPCGGAGDAVAQAQVHQPVHEQEIQIEG